MNKIKISLLALSVGLILGSCKKEFFDVNKDPNRATESSITPDLVLAAQLNSSAARNASSYDFLQRWMGYWSASGSYSRSTVEMSYNVTNDSYSGIWNGLYYSVNQYKSMEKKASELDWKFYQGIAKIMQAHEVAILVDIYGNVPFTTAWDLAGNIRPTYDRGEDIYKALLPMIDSGMLLIKQAGQDPKIGSQDIVFQGNKTNWAKFGNTLKLRLLLHAYKTTVFDRAAEMAKIQAEGSGFMGNGLGAMAQPGYTNDKPNPYYAAHLHTISGNEADNYNRANVFTLDFMKSLSDPRINRTYREAKALPDQFRGTTYGSDPKDDVNSDRTSGPGYGIIGVPTSKFTTPPTAIAATGASKPMWLFTSVEAMFLRAEAAARGWLSGVDAHTAYVDAVKESFKYLAVDNAEAAADTYLGSPNAKVAWPTSGAENDMIAVIAWQKYFALNGIQANETWTDVRRLGVVNPPLSVAPERGSNPIPVRLLYPTSEYNYNADNVNAEGDISQFTSKVFWDL
jgi:hypothetical protein